MLYNKYVCPNPVTITTDGDEVTFSLVDTRPTSPATKRAILHKAACDYVAQNNLSNQVALNCYGFLSLTFSGGMNSASLLIPGLGKLVWILAAGIWNDQGHWLDNTVWNDGE